jgi:7-carboxy-7-deazaguanine synthase
MAEVDAHGLKHVCITGGEPLLQNNSVDLMETLLRAGYIVTLETNGSLDIGVVPDKVYRIMDIKCPGSGMNDRMLWSNLEKLKTCDEIKFVLAGREDFEYAVDIVSRQLDPFSIKILMSPVWDTLAPVVLANWLISGRIPARVHLQMHKILELP